LTGGFNKDSTVITLMKYCYEAKEKALTWGYSGTESDRIKLSGRYLILPVGQETKMESVVDLEVKIPIIGGGIAKFVLKEVESSVRSALPILERHAKALDA
jgi:hypothetical protein